MRSKRVLIEFSLVPEAVQNSESMAARTAEQSSMEGGAYIVVSSAYCEPAIRMGGLWHTDGSIFPNCVGERTKRLCEQSKKGGRERPSLSDSAGGAESHLVLAYEHYSCLKA